MKVQHWLTAAALAAALGVLAACSAPPTAAPNPTEKPTEAAPPPATAEPTQAVTEVPTEAPTEAASGPTMKLAYVEHLEVPVVRHIGAADESDALGDVLPVNNKVFDETNSRELGTFRGMCIRTVAGTAWECTLTLGLINGSVTAEGPIQDGEDSTLAISGGTGDYNRASGQLSVHPNDSGKDRLLTFVLPMTRKSGTSSKLDVVEHADTDAVAHIGPAEETDSVGDLLSFANPVFDTDDKTQVGTDNGLCVRTAVGEAWDCMWTLTLTEGQIMVKGPFYDAKKSRLAVTGGTGIYSHASGQMELSARNDAGTQYDFSYELYLWDAADAPTPLPVIEHADTDTVTQTGPADETDDTAGDVLAFANPIFDDKNTAQLGTDNGLCLRTAVGSAWECMWTVLLPDGLIVVQGPFYDTMDSTLAIIGGTGAYSTASGEMLLHARNDKGSEYDFGYQLSK